jgi:hypothetical protein
MVAPDTWALAGAEQSMVKQSASARQVSKPKAVSILFSSVVVVVVVAPIVVAPVSWFGSDCLPQSAKRHRPSQKEDFLGRDNLHRSRALAQYSMSPIGTISASLRLSLKKGRI